MLKYIQEWFSVHIRKRKKEAQVKEFYDYHQLISLLSADGVHGMNYRALSEKERKNVFMTVNHYYPHHGVWLWRMAITERSMSSKIVSLIKKALQRNKAYIIYDSEDCGVKGTNTHSTLDNLHKDKSIFNKHKEKFNKAIEQFVGTVSNTNKDIVETNSAFLEYFADWAETESMNVNLFILSKTPGGIHKDILLYYMNHLTGEAFQSSYTGVCSHETWCLDQWMRGPITSEIYQKSWTVKDTKPRPVLGSLMLTSALAILVNDRLFWKGERPRYLNNLLLNIYRFADMAPTDITWGYGSGGKKDSIAYITKYVIEHHPSFFVENSQYLHYIQQLHRIDQENVAYPDLIWLLSKENTVFHAKIQETTFDVNHWSPEEVAQLLLIKGIDCEEYRVWSFDKKALLETIIENGINLQDGLKMLYQEQETSLLAKEIEVYGL